MAKTYKDMIAEANGMVKTITVAQAADLHGRADCVFLDVREAPERAKATIPGSIYAPRGLLEFIADPTGPMHRPEIDGSKTLVVFCGTGGRSALSSKTLMELGFEKVCHIGGGITAWTAAGHPVVPG